MLKLMRPATNLAYGIIVKRLALWRLNPAIAIQIRGKPFGMILGMHLLAHCAHCPCCSSAMTLRGATAITNTSKLRFANKRTLHRSRMENACEQRESQIHALLARSRCNRCVVPCHVRSLSLSFLRSPFHRPCLPAMRCPVFCFVMLTECGLRQMPCCARTPSSGEAPILLSHARRNYLVCPNRCLIRQFFMWRSFLQMASKMTHIS